MRRHTHHYRVRRRFVSYLAPESLSVRAGFSVQSCQKFLCYIVGVTEFLKRWWWPIVIIVAIALVVAWKEERCQSQAYQRRAGYIAQLPAGSSLEQRASEQQELTTTCEPNGYFRSLFSAANLPSLLLVIIGFAGIYAAIKTLRAIERQAVIMERQLAIPYRAYLGIIEPEQPINERGIGSPRTWAKFPVINNGHVRARIISVDVEIIIQESNGKEAYRGSTKQSVSDSGEIPPEKLSSYAINVYWPIKFIHADSIVVSVDVEYETGFKEVDTMSFVRVFSPETQKWVTGFAGIDVDVTKSGKETNPN